MTESPTTDEEALPGRTVIADQSAVTRAGIRSSVEALGAVECLEVSDGSSATAAAERAGAALCVLDLALPGGGIATARDIRRCNPSSRIVILADAYEPADLLEALLAGAVGFLPKRIEPVALTRALRGVIAGEAALGRGLVPVLIESVRAQGSTRRPRAAGGRFHTLTAREWEVLHALGDGFDTKEIARRLGISPVTVRRHIGSMLSALGVRDRTEAVRLLDADARDPSAGG